MNVFDGVLIALNFFIRGIFFLLFFVYTKHISQTGALSVCKRAWQLTPAVTALTTNYVRLSDPSN